MRVYIALLALLAAAPARAADIDDLVFFYAGSFNSSAQHVMEAQAGMSEQERHPWLVLRHRRVEVPAFGDYVFLVEERPGNKPEQVVRRRLAVFDVTPENAPEKATVRLREFTFKDEAAASDLSALAGLSPNDVAFRDGCDVLFSREARVFNGAMKERACIPAGDARRYLRYSLIVTDEQIMRVDRTLFINDDSPADGRGDDFPAVYVRDGVLKLE